MADFKKKNRHLSFTSILAVIAISLLTGCATNLKSSEVAATFRNSINEKDGTLVLKVIGANWLGIANQKWHKLVIRNVLDGSIFSLADVLPHGFGASLFLKNLPAGQYEILGFDSEGIELIKTTSIRNFGTFSIKPATVTNLGTITFAVRSNKEKSDLVFAVLNDQVGTNSAFSAIDTKTQKILVGKPVIGWDKNLPTADNNAFKEIKNYSTLEPPIAPTKDGTLYVGGSFGRIAKRSSNGEWTSTAIDTLDAITLIVPFEDGQIFAATDSSRYFVWSPAQNLWKSVDLPDGNTRARNIVKISNDGYMIEVRTAHAAGLSNPPVASLLYTRNLDDASGIKEVASLNNVSWSSLLFNGQDILFYFNTPGFGQRSNLYRISPKNLEIRSETLSYLIHSIIPGQNATLLLDSSEGTFLSLDNGTRWVHARDIASLGLDFSKNAPIYGVTRVSMGFRTNILALQKSTDGRQSWTQVGTSFEGNSGSRAYTIRSGEIVLYTLNKFMSSFDEGQNWKAEKISFD